MNFKEYLPLAERTLSTQFNCDEFYQKIWDVITAGEEWNGEFCNQKKNGELFWTLASISPVKNLEGKIAYYLAIQQDITEQKETAKILEAQHIEIQETMRKLQQTQSHLVQHEKMAGIGPLRLYYQASPIPLNGLRPPQDDGRGFLKIHSKMRCFRRGAGV